MLNAGKRSHMRGPRIGLHTKDMLRLFCTQCRRYRFKLIDFTHRYQLGAPRGFLCRSGLQIIQIHIAGWVHHHIMPRLCCADAALNTTP